MRKENLVGAINARKTAGKTVIGCFPLYPSVELFEAMGFLPVVLWNLKDELQNLEISDKHVQNYACGIARELVQFVLSESGRSLDGIFSYNACDTLRNLPEILAENRMASGMTVPMMRMHVPQVNRNHTDPGGYLKREFTQLIDELARSYDAILSPGAFAKASEQHNRMRHLCMDAEFLVANGALPFARFCEVVLSGYALPVEERIACLVELIDQAGPHAETSATGIVLSGIMPPPKPVVKAIETSGLRVVGNDIASLRRSYGYCPDVSDDPVKYYTDMFANRFPCTTLLYQSDQRIERFLNLVESSGAEGVIFSGEKFCEYEYFEFPYLEKCLKDMGIPVLRLEFGIDDTFHTEAYTTRVEAFSELFL